MVAIKDHKDVATRAVVVGLKALTGWSSADIALLMGISVRQVNRIYARAVKAGFDPTVRPLKISNGLFADLPRTGRPTKLTAEIRDRIIDIVQRSEEHVSARKIADQLNAEGHMVSAMLVWRFLKKAKLGGPPPANHAQGLSDHLADLNLSQREQESSASEGDENRDPSPALQFMVTL